MGKFEEATNIDRYLRLPQEALKIGRKIISQLAGYPSEFDESNVVNLPPVINPPPVERRDPSFRAEVEDDLRGLGIDPDAVFEGRRRRQILERRVIEDHEPSNLP